MSDRVLNFFEFFEKYSTGNTDPLGVDSISNASSNFEEGFDDSTYDQPDLGPKRPVSGSYEATPAMPGEGGVPAFSPGEKSGMSAPEEDETEEEETLFPTESEEDEEEDDDSGNPEGEEDEEEEEEKVEENFNLVKSFSTFVNESYDGYTGDDYSSEYGSNPEDYFGYGANPEGEEIEGEEIMSQVETAVAELSDEEKKIIADYLSKDPEEFQEMIEDELEQQTTSGANPRKNIGMGKEEFETRKVIDKIIKRVAIGAALATVPAAMFISGGLALALGVTGLVGGIMKDAAWAKKGGGHHYKAQNRADLGLDYPEEEYGTNPEEEDSSFCEVCGAMETEYGYNCGCNM